MLRLTAFTLALALAGTQALADTEICQTVNGRTTCTRATGNVSCISINGETRCTSTDPENAEPPPPVELPEVAMRGVEIRKDGNRLRVVAGGTEIWLPQ